MGKVEINFGDKAGEFTDSEVVKIAWGCKQKAVKDHFEAELNNLAKGSNLNSLEKLKGNFELVPQEFLVGVILTPTMKL